MQKNNNIIGEVGVNYKYHLWCLHGGWIALLGYLFGFAVLARFVFPIPGPDWSEVEMATFYQNHLNMIKAGMILAMSSLGLLFPLYGVVSLQMARVEGREGGMPLWSLIQFGCAVQITSLFLLNEILWCVAAFRPDYNPQIVRMINDMSWFLFEMPYPLVTLQMFTFALVGFMDKSEHPLFPRWACHVFIWVGVTFVGGAFVPFFKTGPFAWDGLIAFWIPATCYIYHVLALVYFMRKAILRQAAENSAVAR